MRRKLVWILKCYLIIATASPLNYLKVTHAEREILEINQDIRVSLLNWIIHGLVRTDYSLMCRDLAMLLGLARVVGLHQTLGETGKRKESGEEKSDVRYRLFWIESFSLFFLPQ